MKYIEPEVSEGDLEQITKGFTSGVGDDGQYRVTWSIKIEKLCTYCNGTGEVDSMEQVYPGEPHQAPIGTRKCECQLTAESETEMDDDS